MRNDWNGLIKVQEIQHKAKDGTVLWEQKDAYNILHLGGQELILRAMFAGGRIDNPYIPERYYFGLDYRPFVNNSDTMAIIANEGAEPSSNGYTRAGIDSINQFSISVVGGITTAACPIISFNAAGGSWGPVRNLFLTTSISNSGTLIASVPLSAVLTVDEGETISLRMALSLQDYPA